ncbi:hypothetical protein PVK06_024893 [Gossypium arboreum]|uniref:Uncharacterized protein n=1 Tax=Gossypium arboreum TaxID=29729 RepID=A0ABR0PF88_GOSAR|nr:hypothetical protein PVK06_024893 [Gossypium arboreum]
MSLTQFWKNYLLIYIQFIKPYVKHVVLEFYTDLIQCIDDPTSKLHQKVYVRGKLYKYGSTQIKQLLQHPYTNDIELREFKSIIACSVDPENLQEEETLAKDTIVPEIVGIGFGIVPGSSSTSLVDHRLLKLLFGEIVPNGR